MRVQSRSVNVVAGESEEGVTKEKEGTLISLRCRALRACQHLLAGGFCFEKRRAHSVIPNGPGLPSPGFKRKSGEASTCLALFGRYRLGQSMTVQTPNHTAALSMQCKLHI